MKDRTANRLLRAEISARATTFDHSCRMAAVLVAVVLVCVGASAQSAAVDPHRAAEEKAQQTLSGLPLLFEQNRGQTDATVSFQSRTPQYTLFLTGQDATIVSMKTSKAWKKRGVSLRMHWVGANSTATASGDEMVAGKSNYLVGSDATQWHTDVANYERVRLDGLYPGIDLVYYGNQQTLEYDLNVAPGADPGAIRLRIDGAKKLLLDKANGDLLVRDTTGSEMRLHKPVFYQGSVQQKHLVQGSYVLAAENTVTFRVGTYDHTAPLVIDPSVVYSATFGASSPTSGTNQSTSSYMGMAVDSGGFVYMGGYVNGNLSTVPTTAGSFQPACATYTYSPTTGICQNFFVAKFDPTKSGAAALIYATYIGGTENGSSSAIPGASKGNGSGSSGGSNGSQGGDLAIDSAGDVYFTGVTGSYNYPTTAGAYQPTCNINGTSCAGAVLTKLNASGNALLYSTYFLVPASAGVVSPTGLVNGYGILPSFVAVDAQQVAYIAGTASGVTGTDGSSCNGASCNSNNFVAAFDTTKTGTSSLVYSEYVPMLVSALAADAAGNAYLGGEAYKVNGTVNATTATTQTFTYNGFQTSPGLQYNSTVGAALARLNHAGLNTYATYVGQGYGTYLGIDAVSVNANGTAYIGGAVNGPAAQLNGLPSTSSYTGNGPYLAQVDTTRTGLASLLYGTFLSTQQSDAIYAVADNGAGKVAFSVFVSDSIDPYYPYTNVLTQPSKESDGSKINDNFLGGLIDTTQAGTAAVLFLSPLDGVSYAYNVAIDSGPNFYVAGGGSNNSDFLTVPASYLVTNATPFFYKIPLGVQAITVSPASLTFGSQLVNTTSTSQPVTVTNSGSTAVTFTSIAASSQFAETDNCSPSLAANSNCTVNVTFKPTAVGTPTGTLTLTDSDTSSPQTVSLSGTGVAGAPAASLNPTRIAFANQTAGTTSSASIVVLTNTGNAVLNITSIGLTGTNPGAFGLNTSACGATLAASGSCNISVNFTPPSSGSYSATLSVADNATGSPQTASLTGTGIAVPTATLTPSPFNYGNVSDTTTVTKVLALTNNGAVPFPISNAAFSGQSGTAANYSIYGTTCNGTPVAAGSSCTYTIAFEPTATGTSSINFSVVDSTDAITVTAMLSGTGAFPSATLLPSPVNLGTVNLNTTVSQQLTLTNTGTVAFPINSYGLQSQSGAAATYSIASTTCGTSLAAGSNCTFTVSYKPTAAGSSSVSLVVFDTPDPLTLTAALSGIGATPTATLLPTPLSFGNVSDYTTVTRILTLTNTGGSAFPVSTTSFSAQSGTAANYSVYGTTCYGAPLAAGSSCTYAIAYEPMATGSSSINFSVTDSTDGVTFTAMLSGTGAFPSATLLPSPVNLGNVNLNTAVTQVLTLANTGTVAFPINSVALQAQSGAAATYSISSRTCGTSLAAGANCSFTVSYTPTATGSSSISLVVFDTVDPLTLTAALNGTGVAAAVAQAVLTPNGLSFSTNAGTTSAAQTLSLSNPGTAPLSISGITLIGANAAAFGETTNCGASLATGATCTISVSFSPAAAGAFSAAVNVADNVAGSPQTASLSGTGNSIAAFTVTAVTPQQTVDPGTLAKFTFNVTSINGSFNNPITFSVTGLPGGATASFSPASVTPGTAGGSSVLSIQAPLETSSLGHQRSNNGPWLAFLGLPVLLALHRKRFALRRASWLAAFLLTALSLGLIACGGGYYGPPPQSYTLTVNANGSTYQQAINVTLVVE